MYVILSSNTSSNKPSNDNVLTLKVHNLLAGWPMYVINFTASPLIHSGPWNLSSILILWSRNSFHISKMPWKRYMLKNLTMKIQISLVRTERLLASGSAYQSKSKLVMNSAYIKFSLTREPYISKPTLGYTKLHRIVQTHRPYRKVSSNTEVHRTVYFCVTIQSHHW